MSYVIAAPEMMTSAAADLATIGSNVNAAHMAAAARTVAVIPGAADEVSTGIAHLFSQHAANYQALAGQAAAFQEQFVQHLTAGAFSYAGIEAQLASFLQNANGFVSFIAADVSFIASDPLLVPWVLFVLPAFLLFGAFWIGVILGLVFLYQQLIPLLASFGI
jgi:hypothetical protein